MEFICSIFGFVAAFLGMDAIMRLPRYLGKEKHGISRWLTSGAFKGFAYTTLSFCIAMFFMFWGDFRYALECMIVSPGTVLGGAFGGVIFGIGLLKYLIKADDEPKRRKEEKKPAKGQGILNEIRLLRIQIQEEMKRKEQEARRMMNDTYLNNEAKAEILNRYRDCIKLLQELYAEASNVLAYLETSGADFKFDLDSLYVSEDKQNDLQGQLDRLKAFRQLNSRGSDEGLEELMRKYDADFQKIRGRRQVR